MCLTLLLMPPSQQPRRGAEAVLVALCSRTMLSHHPASTPHTLQALKHLFCQGDSASGSSHTILALQANHKLHELLSHD